MVSVLTAFPINGRRLTRKLARGGYHVSVSGKSLRVQQIDGRGAVDMSASRLVDLPDGVVKSATQLLGLRPRDGITCTFDGLAGKSPDWLTVIDIACAVAAGVPLAVLADHAGTVYLIHPGRGLIGPEEYGRLRPGPSTAEMLRGFLRDRR